MSTKRYDHILATVTSRPWAVLPEVLETVRTIVAMRIAGDEFTPEEIQERVMAARRDAGDRKGRQSAGDVAVIPLYGMITPKADLMSEMSGATSMEAFSRALRTAMADEDVATIVLDVDSPGGLTDMVPETARLIRDARAQKPIVAVSNTLMASAAYYLSSQATEVVASPSASVGSIGVLGMHQDLSGMYEQKGVKTTLIRAGRFKAEANQFEPLSDEALAYRQGEIDELYDMFISDVAKGRGVKASDVRNGFGEGRTLLAKPALAAGLIDRIETLDQTIDRVLRKPPQPRAGAKAGIVIDPPGILALEDEPTLEEVEAGGPDSAFDFEMELLKRRAVQP